jgi:poly [ADP-ribose] polymerase
MSKKVAYLICIADNGNKGNNKFYNMQQISDDEFVAEWGRVEGSKDQKKYPMSEWDKIYKDKTRSSKKPVPYTDVTHLRAELVVESNKGGVQFDASRPEAVCKFVEKIMSLAKEHVVKNYVVSSAKVSKAQVDEAQSVLDKISAKLKVGGNTEEVNNDLLELYKIIPRKMVKVQDHLIKSMDSDSAVEEASMIFTKEQDSLDAMSGQVAMSSPEPDVDKPDADFDVLESLQLDAQEVSPAEIRMIKDKMGRDNAHQFVRAIRVRNERTEKAFNDHVAASKNKKTDLLWHGSRNENWWSIMQQGLKIRPSNAVLTGAMFGNGVYWANKAQKSIGYTSLDGSYWARGGERFAYLALYEVHQGKQKIIERHQTSHKSLDEFVMKREGCDSVYAKGGYDLRNDEFITYNVNQSTIRYIIEIKSK